MGRTWMGMAMADDATGNGALTAPDALVLDLLAWIAARPRTYRETMEAWQRPARACRSGKTRSNTDGFRSSSTVRAGAHRRSNSRRQVGHVWAADEDRDP